MSDAVVPYRTRLAAKRAFVRTSSQTLSSVIPISGIAIGTTQDFWIGFGLGAAGAVVSALLAGGAAALQIISSGVPQEYVEAGFVE